MKTQLKHDSNEFRTRAIGIDSDGFTEYEAVPIPCGEWSNGHRALCDDHEKMYTEMYPQGWAYYPGDICPHGKYTGGSGVDWMCGACELGE